MAIESIGYPGTILPGEDWAAMQRSLGKHLAVDTPTAFRVTAYGAGTRQVDVAAARAMGDGIHDRNTASIRMASLPSVASGSKYFLIVLNRRWNDDSNGYRSELGYVEGTASRTVPAYTSNPGTLSQHPLALVRITAGNTVPTEVVDLRVVSTDGGGGATVYDDLALANGLGGNYGSLVRNAVTDRTYLVSSNSSYSRQLVEVHRPGSAYKNVTGSRTVTLNTAKGFRYATTTGLYIQRVPVSPFAASGAWVHMSLSLSRSVVVGGAISAGANGNITDVLICTLNQADCWPERGVPFQFLYDAGGYNAAGFGTVMTDGRLLATSLTPNTSITALAPNSGTTPANFWKTVVTINVTFFTWTANP